jgi:hypothetical protein
MTHVPEEITDWADTIVEGFETLSGGAWELGGDRAAHVGAGAYKRAYMILDNDGNETGWIVKYPQPFEDDWGRVWLEWLLYRTAHERGEGQYLPATVWGETAGGTPYMVQEACKEADYGERGERGSGWPEEAVRWAQGFGISDLHGGNIGRTDTGDRPVVLDWGVVADAFWIDNGEQTYDPETAKPALQCWMEERQWRQGRRAS